VTDKDRPRWPRFKTKEAAQEIAARCHAMERQTMVHWRVVNMEDGSWIVAAYKDGWMQRSDPVQRLHEEMAQSA
jgi:hypothetical protein